MGGDSTWVQAPHAYRPCSVPSASISTNNRRAMFLFFALKCRNRRNSRYCSVKVFTYTTSSSSASAVLLLFIPDSFLPLAASHLPVLSLSSHLLHLCVRACVCACVRTSPCLFVSITLALCVKLWNACTTDHLSVSCEACAGRFRI